MGEAETEFGRLLDALLKRHAMTHGQATIRSGMRISKSYWSHMKSGQMPSRKTLDIIAEMFPEDDVAALYIAAGYAPPGGVDHSHGQFAVHPISPSPARLPSGPPIPAWTGKELRDVDLSETVSVPQQWVDDGATIVVAVDGPCLGPRLLPGDLIALKPQDHANHGDVVLARLEDGTYTLKRYAENSEPHLTTADPHLYPPPEGPFEIKAVMVGSLSTEYGGGK